MCRQNEYKLSCAWSIGHNHKFTNLLFPCRSRNHILTISNGMRIDLIERLKWAFSISSTIKQLSIIIYFNLNRTWYSLFGASQMHQNYKCREINDSPNCRHRSKSTYSCMMLHRLSSYNDHSLVFYGFVVYNIRCFGNDIHRCFRVKVWSVNVLTIDAVVNIELLFILFFFSVTFFFQRNKIYQRNSKLIVRKRNHWFSFFPDKINVRWAKEDKLFLISSF